jgi:DNA-binding Lrp family transcriptional regulator
MKTKKIRTSFTLSEEAKRLLIELSERMGISKTDVLEVLLREKGRGIGYTS